MTAADASQALAALVEANQLNALLVKEIERLKLEQAEAIRVAVQEERDRAAAASLGGENAGLKAFSRLLASAVEAEREACAVLVDELTEEEFVRARADRREAVEWCATKIRERGKVGAS